MADASVDTVVKEQQLNGNAPGLPSNGTTTNGTGTTEKVNEGKENGVSKPVANISEPKGLASEDKPVDAPLPLTDSATVPAPSANVSSTPLSSAADQAAVSSSAAPASSAANGDNTASTAAAAEGKGEEAKDASIPSSTAAAAAPTAAAVGEKRKADDVKPEVETNVNGVLPLTGEPATEVNGESAAKKAKTDEGAEAGDRPALATITAPAAAEPTSDTNGGDLKKSNSRKREKKPLPPVGRTARKTRSQGPAEA